ncbi:MAG: YIP1 family protein [Anaerolineae bacterium]|nr:YIP1 family protein [Anaerolineae bacterium]
MNTPFLQRLVGVITFKAPIYREIAHDPEALRPAALVVLISSLIAGVAQVLFVPQVGFWGLVAQLVVGILAWLIGSFVVAFIVANLFKGKTDTGEMLRILGHLSVFNVLAIIPCIGGIAGLVLSAAGLVIAIRESAELATDKAIIAAIAVFVVSFVIGLLIGLIFGVGAAGIAVLSQR